MLLIIFATKIPLKWIRSHLSLFSTNTLEFHRRMLCSFKMSLTKLFSAVKVREGLPCRFCSSANFQQRSESPIPLLMNYASEAPSPAWELPFEVLPQKGLQGCQCFWALSPFLPPQSSYHEVWQWELESLTCGGMVVTVGINSIVSLLIPKGLF